MIIVLGVLVAVTWMDADLPAYVIERTPFSLLRNMHTILCLVRLQSGLTHC